MTASRSAGTLLLWLAPVILATTAQATTHDGKPKMLLHARSVVTKNICADGALLTCQGAVTEGVLNTYYNVFVLAERGNLPSIGAVQLGIDYAGGVNLAGGESPISVYSWRLCGSTEWASPAPAWPAPASGNLISIEGSYAGCSESEITVAGYFYMGAYEPATMSVIARPSDHVLKVATCAGLEVVMEAPDDAGYVTFSDTAESGCNPCNAPCAVVAVEPTTWGRIKAHGGELSND